MNYLYRYDPWETHMRLVGGQLRANSWSRRPGRNSHPHAALIEAEKFTSQDEQLFYICFWKSYDSLLKKMFSPVLWDGPKVIQRVRSNHTFFNAYNKIDDDFLEEYAWLFWKVSCAGHVEGRSIDGIPLCDIEVLDLDGNWRAYEDSLIMASDDQRFSNLGYNSYQCDLLGGISYKFYAANKIINPGGGEKSFNAIVLTHGLECVFRVYNDEEMVELAVNKQLEYINKDFKNIRVFIFDESISTYDSHDLIEVDLYVEGNNKFKKVLLELISGKSHDRKIYVDCSQLKIHKEGSRLYDLVILNISVPTKREIFQLCANVVNSLRES